MTIASIAIIGAGTMGTGIMINAAVSGFDVTLVDRSEETLAAAETRLSDYLARQVAKERLTEVQAQVAQHRVRLTTDLGEVAPADLVIEAVFEEIGVKRQLMAELEQILPAATLIASNTSSLLIADIGAQMAHPERLCGLHYFSPAEINPVVEYVEAEATNPRLYDRIGPFLAATNRQVVRCKDSPGFALNRFFVPYLNEAVRLVDEGIETPGEIDLVATQRLGLPLGPFAVSNIIKPIVVLRAAESLAPLGAFYHPADKLLSQGHSGENWEINDTHSQPQRADLIETRLRGALYLPLREIAAEQIADAAEIDQAATAAFRFPDGLYAQMGKIGEVEVTRLINEVTATRTRAA